MTKGTGKRPVVAPSSRLFAAVGRNAKSHGNSV
jgi:hypothetical protein